jgi:plastocyanin
MMKRWCVVFLFAVFLVPAAAYAQRNGTLRPADPPVSPTEWHAIVGAENHDNGHQALAFLPNELWIHQGDSIMWRFNSDEIHTVSFLKNGQVRLPFFMGCPGASSNPAVFDGSTCVTNTLTGSVTGETFTVFFPATGNWKLVCLIHENMTAVVHVLPAADPLPHDQAFYDREARKHAKELLSDKDPVKGAEASIEAKTGHHHGNGVIAGYGEVSATAGGTDTLSINRFLDDRIVIHAGETVEFDNHDPVTPHTITFGAEPAGDPSQPSADVTTDPDGARHAIISSTGDSTHSGFIVAARQDRILAPQTPLSVTRFRVTFPNAGEFPYICALHDDLGMKGKVIVLP